jgi:hypothetical protein
MLLLETTIDRLTDILIGTRPVAFVPAASRDRALEIAAAARGGGYGYAVLQVRSRGLVVLVMAEPKDERRLRRDVREWGGEVGRAITADEIERSGLVALEPGTREGGARDVP